MDWKSRVRSWGRFWPAWLSAILLALAFPPVNFGLLVFVALAPLMGFLRVATAKDARRAGYIFGFLFFAHQMAWLIPFVQQWTGSYGLAAIPWIITAFLAGFFYSLAAWLSHICWKQNRPWLIPVVWVAIEGFRAYLPYLAFPWGITALPLWQFPYLAQTAAFGTIFMTSAWLVLGNVLVSIFLFPPKGEDFNKLPFGRVGVRMGMVFLGFLVISGLRYADRPETERVVMVVGQPGVDLAYTPREELPYRLQEAAASIMATAVAVDSQLTIFPEGFATLSSKLPPINPIGPVPPGPVMFGGHRREGDKTYQAAFAYDDHWQFADKTRLVTFGEYVPFRESLSFLKNFRLPSGDLVPSDEFKTVTVNKMRVGPLICFEGVFPDLAERHSQNGAQVLVQMSIDDWYVNTPAWSQLWMSSVWRSIESGLPLLRVGGKGQSLATDLRGSVIQMAPPGETVAMRVPVDLPKDSDGFQYRFAFVWLTWVLTAAVGVAEIVRLRRKPEAKE